MFNPKYEITNSILKNISIAEAAKEVVMNASIPESWETKFIKEARVRTIYHTLTLQGGLLDEEEVAGILEGNGESSQNLAVRNLSSALDSISALSREFKDKNYTLTIQTLLTLHRIITKGVVREGYSGVFRVRQIAIRDARSGGLIYSPPPAAEIEYLIGDLINWINQEKDIHPLVKASIAHFELYRIHPFVEDNLGFSMVFSLLILYLEQFSIRGFLTFAEYLNLTQAEYFDTLKLLTGQKVLDPNDRDITVLIDYFVKGVALELDNLKERVRKLAKESKVEDALGEVVQLTERQMIIMDYLRKHKEMRNRDFRKLFPEHSDDTVILELKGLRKKGLVKKEGGTRNAVYVLV